MINQIKNFIFNRKYMIYTIIGLFVIFFIMNRYSIIEPFKIYMEGLFYSFSIILGYFSWINKHKIQEFIREIVDPFQPGRLPSIEVNNIENKIKENKPHIPTPKYANSKASTSFDYSNNNGFCIIGKGELRFETCWSSCSKTSMYAVKRGNIKSLALAINRDDDHKVIKDFEEIEKMNKEEILFHFDFSSDHRDPELEEIVIWQNKDGNLLATKLQSIMNRKRGDKYDELAISYKVLNV